MSAIQEFAAKQKEYNDKMNQSMEALRGDINGLQEKIKKLQDSQSQLSEEDQKSLDELSNHGQQMVDKLAKLDELNAPEIPQEAENNGDNL